MSIEHSREFASSDIQRPPTSSRLLHDLPEAATEVFEDVAEVFEDVARLGNVRIERITSPPQFEPGPVYDQNHDEWVLVLQGWADLEVEGQTHRLTPGDAITLPARTKHRVLRTSLDEPTVWLALHAE